MHDHLPVTELASVGRPFALQILRALGELGEVAEQIDAEVPRLVGAYTHLIDW